MAGLSTNITLQKLVHKVQPSPKTGEDILVIPIRQNKLELKDGKVILPLVFFANKQDNRQYSEMSCKQSFSEDERKRQKDAEEQTAFLGGCTWKGAEGETLPDEYVGAFMNIELTALSCVISPSKKQPGEHMLIIPVKKNNIFTNDNGCVALNCMAWVNGLKLSIVQSVPKDQKGEVIGTGELRKYKAPETTTRAVVADSGYEDYDFGDADAAPTASNQDDDDMPF